MPQILRTNKGTYCTAPSYVWGEYFNFELQLKLHFAYVSIMNHGSGS